MLLNSNMKQPLSRWHTLSLAVVLVMTHLASSAQDWSLGMLPGEDWGGAKGNFDAVWTDSIPERGKGFKPFNRWWKFAETRWAYGSMSSGLQSSAPWKATALEREGRASRSIPIAPVWSQAVPDGVPLQGGAGRVNRVLIDPSDTSHWIACAPSGGLWSSQNSGVSWTIMGTADWAGMGVSDVALHPSNPQVLLAATGDSDFGSAYGIGVMKTEDSGATWSPTGLAFGLSETATVNRIHRKEGAPSQILAATSDGIWVSVDDGETFTQTLEGQCSDLVPHPGAPEVWHAALRPGEVHRSTDGGWTWSPVPGMPNPFSVSRYALATSPMAPNEVWAIGAKASTQGLQGIYHSTDSGATYNALDNIPNLLGYTVSGNDLGGQGFYDLALAVNPSDPNHIVAAGVNLWASFDGGSLWQCTGHWYGADSVPEVHADHHAVTFIPGTSDIVSAHDGGISRVHNGQIQDLSEGLNIGQVYHIGHSEVKKEQLLSGWQDNGVNFLSGSTHAKVIGADGFHCLIDPVDPSTLYAAEYFGKTHRSSDGGWSWEPWIGGNESGVDERGDWDTPMAFSPSQDNRIYVAKRRVYWTQDEGVTWGQTEALAGSQIQMLALSPSDDSTLIVAKGVNAFRTENLLSWSPLMGLPGLPVTDALIHKDADSSFWVSFGGYDPTDRIWKTLDAGQTWTGNGAGLPALPVNVMTQDTLSGDLYAGTDAGVYVLPLGNAEWTPYKAGLPEVVCSDLSIRYSTHELLLATYGRGLWKAPLHTVPQRDAAAMGILGASASACGARPSVTLKVRNAGTDTLVSASVLWNLSDTVHYGFILAPNHTIQLPWTEATPTSLPWGESLTARLLDVVSASGGVANGELEAGEDAVPENDVAQVRWEHRDHTGPVVFQTTADCFGLQTSWQVSDSSGLEWARRQHFDNEAITGDTLCLSHGCFTVLLNDGGGDGLAGATCGMIGDLNILSVEGDNVWTLSDPGLPDPNFGASASAFICLPLEGAFGCTDLEACNFNPVAELDNESCEYDCANPYCLGDFNNDGVYGATDVLDVLSDYGCFVDCSKDVTGDGVVSANDILAVLALYGASCTE